MTFSPYCDILPPRIEKITDKLSTSKLGNIHTSRGSSSTIYTETKNYKTENRTDRNFLDFPNYQNSINSINELNQREEYGIAWSSTKPKIWVLLGDGYPNNGTNDSQAVANVDVYLKLMRIPNVSVIPFLFAPLAMSGKDKERRTESLHLRNQQIRAGIPDCMMDKVFAIKNDSTP
jgi:hypothetical protein